MRALVDTHVLLWWIGTSQGRLSRQQIEFLEDPDNELLWSVVSTVEIGALVAKGTIALDRPVGDWCDHWIRRLGMRSVSVEQVHAVRSADLARIHGDPLDRLLVAQALAQEAAIVTRDRRIARYPVRVVG